MKIENLRLQKKTRHKDMLLKKNIKKKNMNKLRAP